MEDRSINISITAGAVFKIVGILAGAGVIFMLRHIVLDIVAAIVIASAIEPGVTALVRRKIPRILAVILIYLILFSVFFGLFYFFLPSVLEDLALFLATLPAYLESFTRAGAFDAYASILGVPAPSAISANDIMTNIRGVFDI